MADRAIDESAALGTHPERRAGRTPEHPWTNDIEIKSEIWVQQFGKRELDGRCRLRLESLFPQESSCDLGVNLTRTDAGCAIVMLLGHSWVAMIEQCAGKVRRAPAICRRG